MITSFRIEYQIEGEQFSKSFNVSFKKLPFELVVGNLIHLRSFLSRKQITQLTSEELQATDMYRVVKTIAFCKDQKGNIEKSIILECPTGFSKKDIVMYGIKAALHLYD